MLAGKMREKSKCLTFFIIMCTILFVIMPAMGSMDNWYHIYLYEMI